MATPSPPDSAYIRPEVRAFFRDIKEHPDDDTPRLVFADWLQEYGDARAAARGEFLRLNVLRCRLSPDDPNYDLLKRREGQLLKDHYWTWLGPLVDQATPPWHFERGLIQVVGSAEKMLTPEVAAWARTEAGLWVDALRLTDVSPRHLAQLAESPLLPQLNTLDLSDNRLRGLRLLFPSPGVCQLTRLVLSLNRLTAEGIAPLTGSRQLHHLGVLELEFNHLTDDAAVRLANSAYLRNLRVLRLRHNSFSTIGYVTLREAFGDRVSF